MKKIFNLFILSIFVFVSCKKEEVNPDLKSLLAGNWNYEKLVSQSYKADGTMINELVTPINSTDYGYHFFDNGTCTQRFGGEPSKFTYEIISEKEFEVNTGAKNHCTVVSIDRKNIIFTISSKQGSNNYTTSTHYLSR